MAYVENISSAGMPPSRRRTARASAQFWNLPPTGVTRSRRTSAHWSGLRAEYAWHPPFEGESDTQPNRIEVVFSAHKDVILEQAGKEYEVQVRPGAMFIVGDHATILKRAREPSDTLEMFIDDGYLAAIAEAHELEYPQLVPTLGTHSRLLLPHDPVALGIAHLLRRACIGSLELSDVEASTIAAKLAEVVLTPEPIRTDGRQTSNGRLDGKTLTRVTDYIESQISGNIAVIDLAAIAGLSLFHFTRAFRNSIGMPPHQYVISRRLERAKILLISTDMIVQDIAWTLGFENLSHFRRKFHEQFGVTPARLREM